MSLKKEVKKAKEFKAKLENLIENNTVYDRYTKVLGVNIKRHQDFSDMDIDDSIKRMSIRSKYWQEMVKAHFTDEKITSIWRGWLEDSAYDLISQIKSDYGITVYSCGRQGGYLYLDNQYEIIESALDEVSEMIDDYEYLLDVKGRLSSGESLNDIKEEIDRLNEDIPYLINDRFDYDIFKALNDIDNYNKGLKFSDELDYRVDEFLSDNMPKCYNDYIEFFNDITGKNIIIETLLNMPIISQLTIQRIFSNFDDYEKDYIFRLCKNKSLPEIYKMAQIGKDEYMTNAIENYLVSL